MKVWVFGKKILEGSFRNWGAASTKIYKNAPSALLSYISTQEFLRT